MVIVAQRHSRLAVIQLAVVDPGIPLPKRIKIIAAVIGVVLWAASLRRYATTSSTGRSSRRAFCLYVRNQHQRSQRVFKPVFQPEIVLIALAYTAMAVLLWTRLRRSIFQSRGVILSLLPCFMAYSASDRHEYVYQKQAV